MTATKKAHRTYGGSYFESREKVSALNDAVERIEQTRNGQSGFTAIDLELAVRAERERVLALMEVGENGLLAQHLITWLKSLGVFSENLSLSEQCVEAVEVAVESEREACAALMDEIGATYEKVTGQEECNGVVGNVIQVCDAGEAIRARSGVSMDSTATHVDDCPYVVEGNLKHWQPPTVKELGHLRGEGKQCLTKDGYPIGVEVFGFYYSIAKDGIYRNPCNGELADFAFAGPVSAELKRLGLTVENIQSVGFSGMTNQVLWFWQISGTDYRVRFNRDDDSWSPIEIKPTQYVYPLNTEPCPQCRKPAPLNKLCEECNNDA
jgi:hypothetical protein